MGDETEANAAAPRPSLAEFEQRLKRAEFGAYVATMASAAMAIVALGGAIWQVGESRNTQREATAYQAFDSYLRLAIDHPDLVCVPTQEGMEAIAAKESDNKRYSVFLGIMLSASEQILDARPNDAHWRAAIRDNLKCHAPALSELAKVEGGYDAFSCQLRAEVAGDLGLSEASCR